MEVYKISQRWRLTIFSFALLFVAVLPVRAQSSRPFLDPLFTDNAVLQRDIPDAIWGWTTPGQTVNVTLAGKSVSATVGVDGKWIATIGPLKAGGPYTLTVSGPQTVTLNNILIGDVWICSGQSNMEFGIGNANNSATEIANANYPTIRIFTVSKSTARTPQELTTGQWAPVTPESVKSQGTWNGFSAVGYFFGRALESSLNVPIGLIQTSWGGTPAEAWTSKEALATNLPEFVPELNALTAENGLSIDQIKANWYTANDPGAAGNWQDPATDTTDWKPITLPGYFQQAGIPELSSINGIVWFRDTFDLPAADTGKDGVLHILVDDNDTTWLNGTLIGATEGYSVARSYAVPSSLLKATGNVLVVRDLDTGGAGGIYGDPTTLKLTFDSGQDIPLAGTWLYRLAAIYSMIAPYPAAISSNPDYPTTLYNGMISPLLSFGFKGVIWYQGEQNAGNPIQYRTLLPTMITDWRNRWNEGNFPFLIVQLAGWQPGGRNWPELREAQWLTSRSVANTGIVTAIDVGDQTNIHPTNKQEVGRRLALVALAQVYGKKVDYSGPVFKSLTITGSSIRVDFDHVDGGLVAQGGTPLAGFEIAGPDGNFVAASAAIQGKSVVVSSPLVPSPVAVQYDWSAFPPGNLYNKAGLPTFPFKSDEK